MKVFGITGGTGAGKTTVLDILTEMNVEILDCDVIYHELIHSSKTLRTALTQRFGDVFNEKGLDRQKLGTIVFHDSKALKELNQITLQFIEDEVHRRMTQAEQEHRAGVAIDAIGLLESDVKYECDALVAITAPVKTRIQRIMAREGITEEYARSRINAQPGENYFRENCTYLLENNGTQEAFCKKVKGLFSKLLTE